MHYTVPSAGGFDRKPYSTPVLTIHTKNICETRKLEYIHEIAFLHQKSKIRKPDESSLRRLKLMPFKNSISEISLKMTLLNSISGWSRDKD
jgi:hypothetical protein